MILQYRYVKYYWIFLINYGMRSKELGACVLETLTIVLKTSKYNEVSWLLLSLLDKVREKRMSSDSNSQVKCSINDLKVSMYNLKYILIFYSHKTDC